MSRQNIPFFLVLVHHGLENYENRKGKQGLGMELHKQLLSFEKQ